MKLAAFKTYSLIALIAFSAISGCATFTASENLTGRQERARSFNPIGTRSTLTTKSGRVVEIRSDHSYIHAETSDETVSIRTGFRNITIGTASIVINGKTVKEIPPDTAHVNIDIGRDGIALILGGERVAFE